MEERRRSRKGRVMRKPWSKCFFPILIISMAVSLLRRWGEIQLNPTVARLIPDASSSFDFLTYRLLQRDGNFVRDSLQHDFYWNACPNAEEIVRKSMARIYSEHPDVSANLLRLIFHDCFIKGCDASVFLDDSGGNQSHRPEKLAPPNRSLKGFDKIDIIKEEIENHCPGIVSCSDILVLATRDGIVLAGGPFYPLLTSRRDRTESYYAEAMAEIPKPDDNIDHMLHLFSVRGFYERETVGLYGGHNIGSIGCEIIEERLQNFLGTGHPDPTIGPNFLNELRQKCDDNSTRSNSEDSPVLLGSEKMTYTEDLSNSILSRGGFNNHYFRRLLIGRGLLYADQQLMANGSTADLLRGYAYDGGLSFRMDFARAMMKLSNLGVLTGRNGQIRKNCSSLST